MFKFYANENLSLVLVNHLRSLGYDVLTSHDLGRSNQRIPDEQVLATAIADNRAVITFNRDDFLALHQSGILHQGMILCKDDRDYLGQASALHSYLLGQVQLNNRCIRVLK